MGFAVRVRSAGQKYGPTCHQRDRADVTEIVTLVRLSSLGQHVDVVALAGYKRRKSALTSNPIDFRRVKVAHSPVIIKDTEVSRIDSYKYLGFTIQHNVARWLLALAQHIM